jgi:hypothetical protein
VGKREAEMGEGGLTWHSTSSLELPEDLLLCWLTEQGVEDRVEIALCGHWRAVEAAGVRVESREEAHMFATMCVMTWQETE